MRFTGWLALGLVAAALSALQATTGDRAEAPGLSPHLVAISVADLEGSIEWYSSHLGFELVSSNEYPDYGLAIALLERSGFRLELIEHAESVAPHTLLPDSANPATLQGFVKLAFWVEEIGELEQRFRRREATFAMEPRDNVERGTRSFIVLDNSGNWLQLVGPLRQAD